MFYFFKLFLLLINIDQETILNLFGIEILNPDKQLSSSLSLETLNLILNGLWQKVYDGLTLADIENLLFVILFLRFLILALRYNIKTSFYITCIGFFCRIFMV
jgi:hypothetical protein